MNVQPTRVLNKVQTAAVSGAISAIVIWLLTEYGQVVLPEYVAAAITTIIMSLVAYITPLLPGEIELVEPLVFGNGGRQVDVPMQGTDDLDRLGRIGPE